MQTGDILTSRTPWLAARMLLAMILALSGATRLADFDGSMTGMSRTVLGPVWIFDIAVALILLVGTLAGLFHRRFNPRPSKRCYLVCSIYMDGRIGIAHTTDLEVGVRRESATLGAAGR